VLDVCQEAICEKTDIDFTYEIHSKIDKKTDTLRFIITEKKDFKDPMEGLIDADINMDEIQYTEAIPVQMGIGDSGSVKAPENSLITALCEVCNNEFDSKKIQALYSAVKVHAPDRAKDEETCKNYISYVFNLMETYAPTQKNRLGYMLKVIKRENSEKAPLKEIPVQQSINRFANFPQRDKDYSKYEELDRLIRIGKIEEAIALRNKLGLEIS
jgi:plasmid replication initiation protein